MKECIKIEELSSCILINKYNNNKKNSRIKINTNEQDKQKKCISHTIAIFKKKC